MKDTNQLPEPELGYIKTDKSNQPAFSARQMREAMKHALQARAQVQGEPFGYIHHFAAHDESGALIDTTWEADGCADPLPHPTFPAMWKWAHCTPFYTTPQPAHATQAEAKTDDPVQVFLVRDVASLLGASVPDVCDALAELGYEPRRSTNAAISPDEAIAVAKRINPAPGVPVAYGVPNGNGGVKFGKGWAFSPKINTALNATMPLYTHPAPHVPDDVARDAERYRWLRDNGVLGFSGAPSWRVSVSFDAMDAYAQTLDSNIDAAMLAAKDTK